MIYTNRKSHPMMRRLRRRKRRRGDQHVTMTPWRCREQHSALTQENSISFSYFKKKNSTSLYQSRHMIRAQSVECTASRQTLISHQSEKEIGFQTVFRHLFTSSAITVQKAWRFGKHTQNDTHTHTHNAHGKTPQMFRIVTPGNSVCERGIVSKNESNRPHRNNTS